MGYFRLEDAAGEVMECSRIYSRAVYVSRPQDNDARYQAHLISLQSPYRIMLSDSRILANAPSAGRET